MSKFGAYRAPAKKVFLSAVSANAATTGIDNRAKRHPHSTKRAAKKGQNSSADGLRPLSLKLLGSIHIGRLTGTEELAD